MNGMKLKTVLIDFDGTISDSVPVIFNTIDLISKKYGIAVSRESIIEELRNIGIKAILKKHKISWYKLPFFLKDFRAEYRKEKPYQRIIKGIQPVILELKNLGFKLGLITSNGKANVLLFLKNNNLNVFDFIFSDIRVFGKISIIKKFLRKNSFNPQEVIYLGDEIRDIEAAKRTGIKIIAVSWGLQSRQSLAKYNPDFLIDQPEEIIEILKSFN
jgi:HAD superfamily hydrolase (TIGR01549 family)